MSRPRATTVVAAVVFVVTTVVYLSTADDSDNGSLAPTTAPAAWVLDGVR